MVWERTGCTASFSSFNREGQSKTSIRCSIWSAREKYQNILETAETAMQKEKNPFMCCHAGQYILMYSWKDLYFSCKAIEETGCLFKNNAFNVVILFTAYFFKKETFYQITYLSWSTLAILCIGFCVLCVLILVDTEDKGGFSNDVK